MISISGGGRNCAAVSEFLGIYMFAVPRELPGRAMHFSSLTVKQRIILYEHEHIFSFASVPSFFFKTANKFLQQIHILQACVNHSFTPSLP
jgi:hypothetical protein